MGREGNKVLHLAETGQSAINLSGGVLVFLKNLSLHVGWAERRYETCPRRLKEPLVIVVVSRILLDHNCLMSCHSGLLFIVAEPLNLTRWRINSWESIHLVWWRYN